MKDKLGEGLDAGEPGDPSVRKKEKNTRKRSQKANKSQNFHGRGVAKQKEKEQQTKISRGG